MACLEPLVAYWNTTAIWEQWDRDHWCAEDSSDCRGCVRVIEEEAKWHT